METLTLYNSLSRTKERFSPVRPGGPVRLYTCGPTLYGRAHIGNLRSYVFADLLRRTLEHVGYQVKQVMNLTDVDDKTIRDSNKLGQSLADFTAPFKDQFLADIAALQISPPSVMPAATAYIPQMVAIIERLLERGLAYKSDDGSVYFSIAKFKPYGQLNHINLSAAEQNAASRQQADEYDKADAADFALWKAWTPDDGDVSWPTSLGKGRPGWHIECSAMSMAELTDAFQDGHFQPDQFETLDLHTGGVDNQFPHHEDEIAQSEGATGQPFARFFLHGEHLLVDGQKMAKSLGNVYTLADLTERGFSPLDFRFLLLQVHYRQKLNFTWASLAAAKEARASLNQFLVEQRSGHDEAGELIIDRLKAFHLAAETALLDDLNTASLVAEIMSLKKDLNRQSMRVPLIAEAVMTYEPVLAIGLADQPTKSAIPESIQQLAAERQAAKAAKDYTKADALRAELAKHGYSVADNSDGNYSLTKA